MSPKIHNLPEQLPHWQIQGRKLNGKRNSTLKSHIFQGTIQPVHKLNLFFSAYFWCTNWVKFIHVILLNQSCMQKEICIDLVAQWQKYKLYQNLQNSMLCFQHKGISINFVTFVWCLEAFCAWWNVDHRYTIKTLRKTEVALTSLQLVGLSNPQITKTNQ